MKKCMQVQHVYQLMREIQCMSSDLEQNVTAALVQGQYFYKNCENLVFGVKLSGCDLAVSVSISFFLILTTSLTQSKLKQKERLLFVTFVTLFGLHIYPSTMFSVRLHNIKSCKTIKVQQTKPVSLKDFYSRTIFQSSYENLVK